MRLAIIGQSAFGKAVLERLTADARHDIAGVFAAPDSRRGPEPLAEAARDLDIPVWQFDRLRDAEAVATFDALNAELCVMAYVTDIVPTEMINAPTLGTIQYHPSLLPKHRGPSAINWACINGDQRTGLTIFWPDEGLDTGNILLQREVDIGPNDTVGSLYFQELFPMGVDALVESVTLVEHGDAPSIPQDESQATYEGWCGRTESQIDWIRPAPELHNLIRGCDPQPGAWTTLQGERLSLYASKTPTANPTPSQDSANETPGTILAVDESGITVRTGKGGAVTVARVRQGTNPKLPAAETGLKPGETLG